MITITDIKSIRNAVAGIKPVLRNQKKILSNIFERPSYVFFIAVIGIFYHSPRISEISKQNIWKVLKKELRYFCNIQSKRLLIKEGILCHTKQAMQKVM